MKESYKKILVAVDLSEQARRAFQEAIEVTRRNDAHLYILIVSDTNHLGAEPYAVDHIVKEAQKSCKYCCGSIRKNDPRGYIL